MTLARPVVVVVLLCFGSIAVAENDLRRVRELARSPRLPPLGSPGSTETPE